MCANSLLIPVEELNEGIVEKYNSEYQQKRIKLSMIEIIDNLEKLYYLQ